MVWANPGSILLLGALAFLQLFPAGIGDGEHALNEPRQAKLDELFRGSIVIDAVGWLGSDLLEQVLLWG